MTRVNKTASTSIDLLTFGLNFKRYYPIAALQKFAESGFGTYNGQRVTWRVGNFIPTRFLASAIALEIPSPREDCSRDTYLFGVKLSLRLAAICAGWQPIFLTPFYRQVGKFGNATVTAVMPTDKTASIYSDQMRRSQFTGDWLQLRFHAIVRSPKVTSRLWGESPYAWEIQVKSILLLESLAP